MKTFENSQPTLFDGMELPTSTSSVAGSRAKTSAPLARGKASKALDLVSGVNTRDWLANFDPATSSWKTAQSCLETGLETYSETWPRSGTMRSGNAYRRPSLVPPTVEIASGLLPTPRKSRGYTNPTLGEDFGAGCLTTEMLGRPVLGMRPLPQFVEWMMGFPTGWTELAPLETPLSRSSRKSLGAPSLQVEGAQ